MHYHQNELSFDAIHTSRFVAFQPLQGCTDLFTCDVSIQEVKMLFRWGVGGGGGWVWGMGFVFGLGSSWKSQQIAPQLILR